MALWPHQKFNRILARTSGPEGVYMKRVLEIYSVKSNWLENYCLHPLRAMVQKELDDSQTVKGVIMRYSPIFSPLS